jgi:hypothetical protein
MKCAEFEAIVAELARGRGLEASVGRDASAHAGSCADCAARLATERGLADALRAFAASMRGQGAPERVEAALLDAFDRRLAAPTAPRPALRLPRWAFGAATAVALVAAGLWLSRPRPVNPPAVAQTQPVAIPAPVPPQRVEPPVKVRAVKRAVRTARWRPAPPRPEVATRFYPLTPVDTLVDVQGGTLVRIGVPRGALASFGWPLDPDGPGGRVEAEVVLDNDTGAARAIRFVSSRP